MKFEAILAAFLLSGTTLNAVGCASYGHDRGGSALMSDATITTKVKTALLAENDVNSMDINVETYHGTVQLTGFVDSKWQIDKAAQVALRVDGVQTVKNDLIHKSK